MSKALLIGLFLFTWMSLAEGQSVDLYSGEAQVANKSEAERQQALPFALIQVLQKQSGMRELPVTPGLDRVLTEAQSQVLAFYYEEHDRPKADGSEVPEEWLVVRFVPQAVDRMVQDLNLPRWRQERLPVTFWILVDDGQGRRLQPLEYAYAWSAMARVAAQRGLPTRWPGLEPEQAASLDLQLLWGGFTEQLPRQPLPDGGSAIIAARRLGADWQLRWTYDSGLETAGWRTTDRDLVFALVEGLHRLTDLIADRDSIRGGASGRWEQRLTVTGLGSARSFQRCLGYLQKLSLVDSLAIVEAQAGQVSFVLSLNADPANLTETLRRDRVLVPGRDSLEYRWSARP